MPDIWMDVDIAITVPCNIAPLIDPTDFKTIEDNTIAYDAAGMLVNWNFVTTAGVMTSTAFVPTTGSNHDWTHIDSGMYKIEIPSAGGTVNNDTEGFGWITGKADACLAFRGPVIGFRASGINDKLIDSAYSATRGLAGTALPDAAADAAGGLPISDAGGLDVDAKLANTNEVTAARMGALTDWIDGGRLDLLIDAIKAKTDNLPADPADASDIDAQLAAIAGYIDTEITAILGYVDCLPAALNNISVADIIAGIADGSYDLQEMLRIMFAAASGKSNGGGTANINFRDSADSKNRITATVDASGNRTAVTLDGS